MKDTLTHPTKEMGMEHKYGQMAPNMRAIGKMIRQKAPEDLFMLMGTFTLVNGKKTKQMVKVSIHILMGQNMKGTG